MMDYPGPTVIEVAAAARHDGNGYAVEIICISSDQASAILVRRGLMRGAGLDTKFTDIQMMRGPWQREKEHFDAALRESARLLATYNKEGYQGNFDDDPTSPGHVARKRDNYIDMRNPKEGARFQWAIEHLFSDAIFHRMMWELFPDMTCDYGVADFDIAEPDSDDIKNAQKAVQYAGAWGEF